MKVNNPGAGPVDWGTQDADTTAVGGAGSAQEVGNPPATSDKVSTEGAGEEPSPNDVASAPGKRLEGGLDGAVMRALLNVRVAADTGSPGAGNTGPATVGGAGSAPATAKVDDALKALAENADFKALSDGDKALVQKALTDNPPVSQDKISKTLDLLGSAKGLAAADHKLVLDGFKAAKADPTYTANLKQLLDDPKFKALNADEKTAVLSQVKNYPDARSVKNIDRMLQKSWFTSQDLSDKQRSLKTVARLSQYPPKGDASIINNTLEKFVGERGDYKLVWDSLHADSGTTYGTGANKVLTLNKDLIAADNNKMVENSDTNHLTLNTVPHEVNHNINDDKVDKTFKYFQAEYRAWYVGFKAENGRAPTNQEAMQQRLNWQLDPNSFYGKQAAEALKDPAEAQKLFDFLGKVTGQTVDASNWKTVIASDPSTWPDHKNTAAAPVPEGNFDNH